MCFILHWTQQKTLFYYKWPNNLPIIDIFELTVILVQPEFNSENNREKNFAGF